MSVDARRQRRRHRLAVRGPPAFTKKVGDVRADRQILHDEARIAFEARAGGRIGLELALLVDRQFRAYAAASTLLAKRLPRFGFARFLHAARLDVRLDVRPSRAALQPRDFVTQRRDCSLRFRQLLEKLQHQALQLGGRKRVDLSDTSAVKPGPSTTPSNCPSAIRPVRWPETLRVLSSQRPCTPSSSATR